VRPASLLENKLNEEGILKPDHAALSLAAAAAALQADLN